MSDTIATAAASSASDAVALRERVKARIANTHARVIDAQLEHPKSALALTFGLFACAGYAIAQAGAATYDAISEVA